MSQFDDIVITGLGMVTPLGTEPEVVLRRIEAGESAAAPPLGFAAASFACPVCAPVRDFQPQSFVAEPKMLRLMNRDAQLAVVAARLALRDARLVVGQDYAPEEVGLFGATGMAGLPLQEVAPLLRNSVNEAGQFDLERFGGVALRSISPILSFKILANLPVCFVSICENLQGANGIYTPWEGQGARALEAGCLALRWGDARCAVVGGCDVKTHELAFIDLQRRGLFESWRTTGQGLIPGEGAVFLVLEKEAAARARGARVYARLSGFGWSVRAAGEPAHAACASALAQITPPEAGQDRLRTTPTAWTVGEPPHLSVTSSRGQVEVVVAAGGEAREAETSVLAALGLSGRKTVYPKAGVGDLFAAAAPLQVALGALLAEHSARGDCVLADCFGFGDEQAVVRLQKP